MSEIWNYNQIEDYYLKNSKKLGHYEHLGQNMLNLSYHYKPSLHLYADTVKSGNMSKDLTHTMQTAHNLLINPGISQKELGLYISDSNLERKSSLRHKLNNPKNHLITEQLCVNRKNGQAIFNSYVPKGSKKEKLAYYQQVYKKNHINTVQLNGDSAIVNADNDVKKLQHISPDLEVHQNGVINYVGTGKHIPKQYQNKILHYANTHILYNFQMYKQKQMYRKAHPFSFVASKLHIKKPRLQSLLSKRNALAERRQTKQVNIKHLQKPLPKHTRHHEHGIER